MKSPLSRLGLLALTSAISCLLVLFLFNNRGILQAYNGPHPIDISMLDGSYDPNDTRGEFNGQQISSSAYSSPRLAQVLGSTDAPKRIEVDLTNQRIYAFEGDKKVYTFLISSGKWYPTPTGTFHIWGKFRYTKMSGGNPATHTYYYLPNVPFVMFFSNSEISESRGFSLHGTYWHNNFGHPMSHGCINMRTQDAEVIYYWSQPTANKDQSLRATSNNPGTEVIIYGEAPKE